MFCHTRSNEHFIKKIMTQQKVKQLLEMLYSYDEETYDHSLRVAYIAMHMCDKARKEKLPGATNFDKEKIVTAALLHDIGKIFIPHKILHKQGALTEAEFQTVEEHPVLGAGIARLYGLPEDICEMIENHHKKMDGSGYPKNNNLPSESAMLVSAADIFSAITEKRSYKDSEEAKIGIEIVNSEIEDGHIPCGYGSLLENIAYEAVAVS